MQVYLSKAGSLLAPDSFMLAMDGELQLISAANSSTGNQSSVEVLAKRVTAYQNGLSKLEGHLKRMEAVSYTHLTLPTILLV